MAMGSQERLPTSLTTGSEAMSERISDTELNVLIGTYEAHGKAASIHQRQALAALLELRDRRGQPRGCSIHGECPICMTQRALGDPREGVMVAFNPAPARHF